MTIGKLFCILLIGTIVYCVGFFSGAAMMEKINDEYRSQVKRNAERIRAERKTRYEMKHLKAEA